MSAPDGPEHCAGPVCITCSDVAVEVTVATLLGDGLALVDTRAGTREEVSVALVDAAVGDVVLVHAGEAIGAPRRPAPEGPAPEGTAPEGTAPEGTAP
ncbi:MAG: HypC/HybG/HupF family hydrogenase formation chaperone [Pseudonocardia sp.]|nr:HypC/HybG/HupF family hydrogenase formation chaperone [Pseudonocardia sp.]